MSIDYDRLRTTVDVVDDPETDKITRGNYTLSLEVQGPALARELLRLRDGAGELVESKRGAAWVIHEQIKAGSLPGYLGYAAAGVEFMCDNLTDLLDGDTE